MNTTTRLPEEIQVSGLVPNGTETVEHLPLTVPLDTPEPAQPQLRPGQLDLEPQHQGGLGRDGDEWK